MKKEIHFVCGFCDIFKRQLIFIIFSSLFPLSVSILLNLFLDTPRCFWFQNWLSIKFYDQKLKCVDNDLYYCYSLDWKKGFLKNPINLEILMTSNFRLLTNMKTLKFPALDYFLYAFHSSYYEHWIKWIYHCE